MPESVASYDFALLTLPTGGGNESWSKQMNGEDVNLEHMGIKI